MQRKDLQRKEGTRRFYDLLEGFDDAMLVTRTREGGLRARPMAVSSERRDRELWFVTRLDSPKVEEIRHDQHVCVTFQSRGRFLEVTGRASVLARPEHIEALWSEAWQSWFPQGKDTPDLAVIEVHPDTAEFWDVGAMERLSFVFERDHVWQLEGQPLETEAGARP